MADQYLHVLGHIYCVHVCDWFVLTIYAGIIRSDSNTRSHPRANMKHNQWYTVRYSGETLPFSLFFVNDVVEKIYIQPTEDLDHRGDIAEKVFQHHLSKNMYRVNYVHVARGADPTIFARFVQSFLPKMTFGMIHIMYDNEPTLEDVVMINQLPSYTLTVFTLSAKTVSKMLTLPFVGLHYIRVRYPSTDMRGPYLHLYLHLMGQKRGYNPLNRERNKLIVFCADKEEANLLRDRLDQLVILSRLDIRYRS